MPAALIRRSFAAGAVLLFLSVWPPCVNGDDAENGDGGPRVETAPHPQVAADLLPMAREALEDFDQGKYRDAEHVYDKLIARDPNNPYLLSNEGVVLFRESKLKSAVAMLKKAVAAAPEDAFTHATLGIVYYSMGNCDAAETCVNQAIAIDPNNAAFQNERDLIFSQKGRAKHDFAPKRPPQVGRLLAIADSPEGVPGCF